MTIENLPGGDGHPRVGGETGQAVASVSAAYPRVGGETEVEVTLAPDDAGLSPRGRGNQKHQHLPSAGQRSIPAWAGKPERSKTRMMPATVYPRVGGETFGAQRSPQR